jgi:sporulation protein YlmC with PRC-barrel domain
MHQNYKKILNSAIHATDGKIGHVDDLLFDDENWVVRYLVVRTGGFLKRKRVLISPLGIAKLDWSSSTVNLHLTRQQIESSPDIDTDLPVFRQMEKEYYDFYEWPYYWDNMSVFGIDPRSKLIIGDQPMIDQNQRTRIKSYDGDPHLRSCKIVSDYSIEAEGERIGQADDFLIDDQTWTIRKLLVDTKKWWPNKSVEIAPQQVKSVDWFGRCIQVNMTKKEIESRAETESNEFNAHP